jgi:hypothetical protein
MLAPIWMMGGMPVRRRLQVRPQAASGECSGHFGERFEHISGRSVGWWMGLVERDHRRRGASVSEAESGIACRASGS